MFFVMLEKGYEFLPMTINVQAELLKLLVCGGFALRLIAKGLHLLINIYGRCTVPNCGHSPVI